MFKRKIEVKDIENEKTCDCGHGEGCNGDNTCAGNSSTPEDQEYVETITQENQLNEVEDEELTKLRLEAEANYDKYLRSVAEFENYKKRALKERSDLLKYGGESLARDILDIVDQLKIALKHEGSGTAEEFMKGVRMVFDNLIQVLARHQVVGEDSVGKPFDPTKHEALATIPSEEYAAGTVMEEFKGAFMFKDKLLRPAQVVVAKEKDSPKDNDGVEQGEAQTDSCNDSDC